MNANFIWHNFGMVGTTQGATNTGPSPYLKNWQQITANGAGGGVTPANFRASTNLSGSVMCQAAGTAISDKCLMLNATTGSATIVNTKMVYLSVSLWASKTGAATAVAVGSFPAGPSGFNI
jgi:hypothetical protein